MLYSETQRALIRRTAWFRQGGAAFKARFPEIAKRMPWESFYVCPICLKALSEDALRRGLLTREHVPPSHAGGRRLVLTCKDCNDFAGHSADVHASHEQDIFDFLQSRSLTSLKVDLKTPSGAIPARLSQSKEGVQIFGVPRAAASTAHERVFGEFSHASEGENWRKFRFSVGFSPYSPKQAAASWLRSAYLAFFSVVGYEFVFRPELNLVRTRIRNPSSDAPRRFRVLLPQPVKPMLRMIESPPSLRSYAMFHGNNLVFLPRYGDHDLYDRLMREAGGVDVTCSGKEFLWPTDGPTFLGDVPAT